MFQLFILRMEINASEHLESPLIYFAANGTYLDGFNGNASISFEAGKTYRLRILNSAAFAMFFFWIDGHQMRVIEVDGVSETLDTERIYYLRGSC